MNALQLARFIEASERCASWIGMLATHGKSDKRSHGIHVVEITRSLLEEMLVVQQRCDAEGPDISDDELTCEALAADVRNGSEEVSEAFDEASEAIITATGGAAGIVECRFLDDSTAIGATAHRVALDLLVLWRFSFRDGGAPALPKWNSDELVRLCCQMERERVLVRSACDTIPEVFTIARFQEMVDLGRDAVREFIRDAGLPVAQPGKRKTYTTTDAIKFLRAVVGGCRSEDSREKAGKWIAELEGR